MTLFTHCPRRSESRRPIPPRRISRLLPAAVPLLLLSAALTAAVASPAAADMVEVLKTAYLLEARLMDQEYARYVDLRRQESDALDKLARLSRRIDDELTDKGIGVEAHRRLEAEITTARELALALSRETAKMRQRLYLRMDRLAELGDEIERQQDRGLVLPGVIGGQWEVEAPGYETYGLFNLKQEGTRITGVYRMSTGAQGSLQGSFVDGVLKLDRVDAKRGKDIRLEGTLDEATGEISGRWWPLTGGSGEPVGGRFTARKVDTAE